MTTQRVTGIASGFDTSSIVESLMSIERVPYDKLDVKKQTEQLKLQAYQAVNTYLLKFRSSISSLSSQKLWNAKATVSTNEKSLTANANEYAVKGSYSFKVAQVANATQFMSKGFASTKAPIVSTKEGTEPYKVGTINLASAKTRVDNSAKVDVLNGGKGIYRGSIRVTDRKNNTSTIDLSGCDTMDDVVRTINEHSGALITASIKEGRLHIQDDSGGDGILKIQNVGAGTTATDLGIAGSGGMGTDSGTPDETVIHGRNVYTLGNDMSLKLVNDGLGVEEGDFTLKVYGTDSYVPITINVDGCSTVGDVINRVNDEIERLRTEGFGPDDPNPGGGDPAELLKGLRFGISGDGTSFSFTGVQANHSYEFVDHANKDIVYKGTPAAQLGLTGKIQTAGSTDKEITFNRILGDVNSPLLTSLGGVTGSGVGSEDANTKVQMKFNADTRIEDLNQGRGVDISMALQIVLLEGGKDANGVEISTIDNMKVFNDILDFDDLKDIVDNPLSTLGDLINFMNDSLADYAADPDNGAAGLTGLNFRIDEKNHCIIVDGIQAGYSIQIAGSLASNAVDGGMGLGITFARSDPNSVPLEIDDKDVREAVDKFYGMGDHNKSITDEFDNKPIDADTTMDRLVNMLSDPDDVAGSLAALFSGKSKIVMGEYYDEATQTYHNYRRYPNGEIEYEADGVTPKLDPATEIELDWDAIFTTILPLDEDTTVGEILDLVNDAIKAEFSTAGYDGNVPEIRVNSFGNGFQWSNMDFTKHWSFEDDAQGALAAMGLAKDTLGVSQVYQPATTTGKNLDPRATGYANATVVDSSNADTITMGEINYGQGIYLFGDDDASIDIEFAAGVKVSITKAELEAAIDAKIALLQAGGSTITDMNQLTVEQYLEVLNDLLEDKLNDHYDPSVDADDRFSMKFAVGENGGLILSDIQNADCMIISGDLVDSYGSICGIAQVYISDLSKIGATTEIRVNNLIAAEFVRQEIDGLGEIRFILGGDESTVYDLKTTGLDHNSTFNDLIDTLNAELDRHNITDIRFTLNESGTGLAVENSSNERITFIDTLGPMDSDPSIMVSDAQHLAQDLGLVNADGSSTTVEAYSFSNCRSIGRNYISRATSLDEYLGANADKGAIQITNALGNSRTVDLSGCLTIGDVIDAINTETAFGVYAQINARGDGIDIIEAYEPGYVPDASLRTGNVSIMDIEGSTAKTLGFAGTGNRDKAEYQGNSVFEGSLTSTIDVWSNDSLESIMYRISETGRYKTAIVNNGSATNPYRLSISSTTTGEANDFVIDTDVEAFGFSQTIRGCDAKVLYGDPNSSSSPIMLSSSTNSNNSAILGLTLDIKSASTDWTTITVDDDKESVVEEIKGMVEAYNELAGIISYLDAYDEETGEPGILFGDTSVRSLMDSINDYFYAIFNPNNKKIGSVDANGVQNTWTWMDMGISLSAANTNTDGTGSWYTTMDLDLDKLDDMVASNWEVLSSMLANQRNASNINNDENVRPTGSFNGELDEGFSVDGAINGDINKTAFGTTNGIKSAGALADGNDTYTIWFQKPTTMTRLSIYHESAENSLKDYTIEYLDSSTGQWKEFRPVKDNTSDANHFGIDLPISMSALRITATETNASHGKFSLLDVQVYEENGLAGQLNQLTSLLGDTQEGFLAERNSEIQSTISDIDEQMSRLLERLDAKEAALWRRFTAMEQAMSQLQSQSSYFSTMMNAMSSSE